jgi:excinuclease UvrABC nuclease subunit
MFAAAESLEFERAAALRDRITGLQEMVGQPLAQANAANQAGVEKRRRKGGKSGGRVPRPKKH